MLKLPSHLQKYIVQQNYERYTPVDQAVWRYVLRQLKRFLSVHAESSYVEGLEKTGIDIEQIPRIENISAKLQKFGWRALPVSGFIPPAAFMELQSLGVLPIASDMRSIDHLLYTPAPDIVHEAAGHAPILANEKYATYLKQYAQVAKKAILNKQDLDLYEAIRRLSDIKENPMSHEHEIAAAESKLKEVSQNISYISEGSELSRMNWWTAEYGLIKQNNAIKIFGAGLLSSIGEARWCLSAEVQKIPLSADCILQEYDITEPQPQLFVAESFEQLSEVLETFSQTMAYRVGGVQALQKLKQAETVNTVQFENGLQISGILSDFKLAPNNEVAYVQFSGPTQICLNDREVAGHGSKYHKDGYGTPIGEIKDFENLSLDLFKDMELNYASGVNVHGRLTQILSLNDSAVILTFSDATATYQGETLFQPTWGHYDIILAKKVVSGFGGPADRPAYGNLEDFVAPRVVAPAYGEQDTKIFLLYQSVRQFRKDQTKSEAEFNELFLKISQQAPEHWLLFIELVEISYQRNFNPGFLRLISFHLDKLKNDHPTMKSLIDEGLSLAPH